MISKHGDSNTTISIQLSIPNIRSPDMSWRRQSNTRRAYLPKLYRYPQETLRQKISVGLACCRINKTRPEVLMIQKRFTYAYNTFVHGKYSSNNNAEIIALLSGMTIEEKHDLLSLNFNQIWYRIWLNSRQRGGMCFFAAKNFFESTFGIDDGARLRRLMARADHGITVWEIPKGRKNSAAEPDIHCAIREFKEETGLSKKQYKILSTNFPIQEHVDAGTKYTTKYFVALTRHNITPRLNFGLQDQIDEISDIRWMGIEDIRRSDPTGRIEKMMKPIFSYVKKYAKK